jgi:hypothetical protein
VSRYGIVPLLMPGLLERESDLGTLAAQIDSGSGGVVTEKTVETHLGHAYAKLNVRSRTDLPDALAAPATA